MWTLFSPILTQAIAPSRRAPFQTPDPVEDLFRGHLTSASQLQLHGFYQLQYLIQVATPIMCVSAVPMMAKHKF